MGAKRPGNRRRFRPIDRFRLLVQSDGCCSICSIPLPSGWHADHVVPWSKGGSTDVSNGQALCPECNLKKGVKDHIMKMLEAKPRFSPFPRDIVLRDGQKRMFKEFMRRVPQDFLWDAFPGYGKTIGSLAVASEMLQRGVVDSLVVIVPTQALCSQWARSCNRIGIQIATNSGAISSDVIGFVETYQWLASRDRTGRNQNVFAMQEYCRKNRVFVIFDEIHHAGSECTWGKSVKDAFRDAKHRLNITGTPFRSDNSQIANFKYEQILGPDGLKYQAIPDASVSYLQAMQEGVCRRVMFPTVDGDIEWIKYQKKNKQRISEILTASLSDPAAADEMNQKYRTAWHWDTPFVRCCLRAAHDQLEELRGGKNRDAQMLWVAMSQQHAQEYQKLIQSMLGKKASLIISDNDDAHEDLKRFRENPEKNEIAISVQMITEGVDIPNLMVEIYASDFMTKFNFYQTMARTIRGSGLAYMYIAKDPRLEEFAMEVEKAVDAYYAEAAREYADLEEHTPLDDEYQDDIDLLGPDSDHDGWPQDNTDIWGPPEGYEETGYKPIPQNCTGELSDVIIEGDRVLPEEIPLITQFFSDLGIPESDHWTFDVRVKLFRRMQEKMGQNPASQSASGFTQDTKDSEKHTREKTNEEIKEEQMNRLNAFVKKLIAQVLQHRGETKEHIGIERSNERYKDYATSIWGRLKSMRGGNTPKKSSITQLNESILTVQEWSNGYPGTEILFYGQ